jgi:hypothetical protein
MCEAVPTFPFTRPWHGTQTHKTSPSPLLYISLIAVGLTPGGSSTEHIWLTPGGSSTVHIWLTPGGSSTVHIYIQIRHNETEYTEQNIYNNKST